MRSPTARTLIPDSEDATAMTVVRELSGSRGEGSREALDRAPTEFASPTGRHWVVQPTKPDRGGTAGAFTLVTRLEHPGSAELYIAERRGEHAGVRRALVKRISRRRDDYQTLKAALFEEARITGAFDHPNLTGLLDAGEDEQGAYLVLEHVEGTNLERVAITLRTRHQALPFELAAFIIAEALRGLDHAKDFVLRDRTPANVLISTAGQVKLTDFSLAHTCDTRDDVLRGAFAYLAPEYVAGDRYTTRSDIYALGVILFELLAGRECFIGETAYDVLSKIVGKGVAWRELEREDVPQPLLQIVARATNPYPGGRYRSAGEMVDALDEWLVGAGKAVMPGLLARFFARSDLFPTLAPQSANAQPGNTRNMPAMRIVRGASIAVTGAPQRRMHDELDDGLDDDPTETSPPELLGREEMSSLCESYRRLTSSMLGDEIDGVQFASPFDEDESESLDIDFDHDTGVRALTIAPKPQPPLLPQATAADISASAVVTPAQQEEEIEIEISSGLSERTVLLVAAAIAVVVFFVIIWFPK